MFSVHFLHCQNLILPCWKVDLHFQFNKKLVLSSLHKRDEKLIQNAAVLSGYLFLLCHSVSSVFYQVNVSYTIFQYFAMLSLIYITNGCMSCLSFHRHWQSVSVHLITFCTKWTFCTKELSTLNALFVLGAVFAPLSTSCMQLWPTLRYCNGC